MADEEDYQVERILRHELYDRATLNPSILFSAPDDIDRKRFHSTYVYLVKWETYAEEFNTWEPEEMFAEGNDVLEEYKKRMGLPMKHSKIYHESRRNMIYEMPMKSRASSSASSICTNPPRKSNALVDDYRRRMRSPLRRNEERKSIAQEKPSKAPSSRLGRDAEACIPAKKAKVSRRDFNDVAAQVSASPPPIDFIAALNQKPSTSKPQKRGHDRSKSPPRAPKMATDVESVESRREQKKTVRLFRYHEDSSNLNCGAIQRELMVRRRWRSAERLNQFWKQKAVEHKQREITNAYRATIYKEQILPLRKRNIKEEKKVNNLVVYMKEKQTGVFKVQKKFGELMVNNDLTTKIKDPLHHSEVLYPPAIFKEHVKKTAKPTAPILQSFRGTINGISACDNYHVQQFMAMCSKDTEVSVLGRLLVAYLNKSPDMVQRLLLCRENRSKIALNLVKLVPLRDNVSETEDVLKSNISMIINSDHDDGLFCAGDDEALSQRHWKCSMIKVLLTLLQPSDYVESLRQHNLVHKAVADSRICQSLALLSAGCSWNDGTTYEVENGLDVDVNLWVLMRPTTSEAISSFFSFGFDPFTVTWSSQFCHVLDPKALNIGATLDSMSIDSSSINETLMKLRSAINQFSKKMIEEKMGPRIQFTSFQYASVTTPHVVRVNRFCSQTVLKRSVLADKTDGTEILGISDVKPSLLKSARLRLVLVVLPFDVPKADRSEDEDQPILQALGVAGLVSSTVSPAAKVYEPRIHIRSTKAIVPLTRLPGVSSSADFYVVERRNIDDLVPGGIEFAFNIHSDESRGQSFTVQLIAVEETMLERNNNLND